MGENHHPPISWRRGFFRIWLVTSAAWISLILIFMITSIPSIATSDDIFAFPADRVSGQDDSWNNYRQLSPDRFSRNGPERAVFETAVGEGLAKSHLFEKFPNIILYTPIDIPEEVLANFRAKIIVLASADAQLIKNARIQFAGEMSLLALLPPVFLIFLGLVLFWIARGFRSKEGQ